MEASNPYAPPQAAVHDVLQTDAPLEHADLGTRFAAAIVDIIVIVAGIYVPFIVAVVAQEGGFGPAGGVVAGAALLVMFAAFVAWCWVTVTWVRRNGQSIGKRLLSIKVVRSDGSRASLGRIFWLRNVVNAVIGIIPLYTLVDHLFIFGAARQCVHDKLADTFVVKA